MTLAATALKRASYPRGRGSADNPGNRFERLGYVPEEGTVEDLERPITQFLPDATRNIISRNDSPDVGFDVSVNPYRGCEHGCAYCYARPTHEYLGFSAGLDFETRIMVKENAPGLLREALRSPRWKPQTLGMSGVTDPYQPIERERRITRGCLEVLAEFRNPVTVITKNRLVTRDIDLLSQLARHEAALVFVSVTTLDLSLNRVLEPRTSSPSQRLDAIRALSAAGIPTGVMIGPVIPGLTESEIPSILEAASEAGAKHAGYIVLRLPLVVAPLFESWLERHYPLRKERVLNRVRAMRGGKLYRAEYGSRMRGEGPFADQIRDLFRVAQRKHKLESRPTLSARSFRVPHQAGDQIEMF